MRPTVYEYIEYIKNRSSHHLTDLEEDPWLFSKKDHFTIVIHRIELTEILMYYGVASVMDV